MTFPDSGTHLKYSLMPSRNVWVGFWMDERREEKQEKRYILQASAGCLRFFLQAVIMHGQEERERRRDSCCAGMIVKVKPDPHS